VPVVLERFAGYLLGGGPVEVADLGAAVADLGESACIEVAAAAQALLARTAYLQDRACAAAQDAEADRDGDDPDPATRYAGRFARSAVIAELATACRLSEGAIWWRVHRSQDLAHLLPGTQARAAAGALGPARVDAVRDKTRDLTPAARHRLDEVIAGRADPLTADEHADPPTQALRPLRGNELATPRRFDNAITRRVTHLSRQTHHATAAPADNPDATTSSDATSSGGDDADSDTTSSGDATSGGGDDAGHPARYTGVNLDHGDNGQGYLTICGPITSLLVVKSALYAADRQGHDVVDTLLTWATHALAGITPPGGTGPTPRPHVLVTVPLATLTGQGDVPAELDRYGPLPTDLLDQVWAQATIRCGVVDPTGTLLALGHPTHTQAYTPPPRLRRFVTIAWVHCAFPGCDKPAATCQLDHTQPWPHRKLSSLVRQVGSSVCVSRRWSRSCFVGC